MKRLKLIASLSVVALVICTSFILISAYSTAKKTTSACATVLKVNPVEIVTNYLEAIKRCDVDKAVSILREVGITETQQKKDLNELLEVPSTQIAEIKDVTLENETNDTATLSMTVEYKDGSIIQNPVSLEKDNGEYKFRRITADEKVIKEATETEANNK